MSPCIMQAMQLVAKQKDRITEQRDQSEADREAAWARYQRAAQRDEKLQAVATRNWEKLLVKEEELNNLFGSGKYRKTAELTAMLKPVVLETVEYSEDETEGEEDEQPEEMTQRKDRPDVLKLSKKGRAEKKTKKTKKMTKAESMFGPKKTSGITAKARPKTMNSEDSEDNSGFRIRERRSESTLSDIVVEPKKKTNSHRSRQNQAEAAQVVSEEPEEIMQFDSPPREPQNAGMEEPEDEFSPDISEFQTEAEPAWSFPDDLPDATMPDGMEQPMPGEAFTPMRSTSIPKSNDSGGLFVSDRSSTVQPAEVESEIAPLEESFSPIAQQESAPPAAPSPVAPSPAQSTSTSEKTVITPSGEPFTWTPVPGLVFPFSPLPSPEPAELSEAPKVAEVPEVPAVKQIIQFREYREDSSDDLFVSMAPTPTPSPPKKRQRVKKGSSAAKLDIGAAISAGALSKYRK